MPRDEQEYERRQRQILDGALQVFSTKGFAEATIKDIAAAAGIASPGLIYHYFDDKADVFRQLVEQRVPVFDLLAHAEALMSVPPRELLTRLGTLMLEAIENVQTVALLKLMLGESVRRPEVAQLLNTVGPGRGFAFLRAYLAHQMELGTLRRMDPGVAVRSLVGPLVIYILTRELFIQPDAITLRPEAMVAGAVDIFLRGMAPDADGENPEFNAEDSEGRRAGRTGGEK